LTPADFVHNHPYQSIVYAILFSNLVATMPSPSGVGIRGSTIYKWAFGFLHAIPNLPRVLATLFPQLAGTMGILTRSETAQAVSSHALNNASSQADKTVVQASRTADAVADAQAAAPQSVKPNA